MRYTAAVVLWISTSNEKRRRHGLVVIPRSTTDRRRAIIVDHYQSKERHGTVRASPNSSRVLPSFTQIRSPINRIYSTLRTRDAFACFRFGFSRFGHDSGMQVAALGHGGKMIIINSISIERKTHKHGSTAIYLYCISSNSIKDLP